VLIALVVAAGIAVSSALAEPPATTAGAEPAATGSASASSASSAESPTAADTTKAPAQAGSSEPAVSASASDPTPANNADTATGNGTANATGTTSENGNAAGNTTGNAAPNNTGNTGGNATGNANANGNGNAATDAGGNSNAAPANGNSTAPANGSGNATGSGNANGNSTAGGANAQASQSDPANTNVNVRVDRPGNDGPVAQSNSSAADAGGSSNGAGGSQASEPASSGATLTTTTDTSPVAQAAADANQSDPINLNVSVRVNSPGDGGPVAQSNSASATAVAGAAGDPGGSGTTIAPSADATQTAPRNVNVVVRIASDGDQGPVAQSNSAVATAGPGSIATGLPSNGDPNAVVDNSATVDQSVEQCPETCDGAASSASATGTNGLNAAQTLDHSTATVTQLTPSNANIVIRVGSNGHNGPVAQSSTATADAAATVSTRTSPDNLDINVMIPGDVSVVTPTGSDPWIWTWTWTGAVQPGPGAAPTSSGTWGWTWGPSSTVNVPAAQAGRWIWSWTWSRGDGWTTTYTSDQPCDCSWVWTWSWIWGAPAPSAPSNDATPAVQVTVSDPQVSQSNTATATATVSTDFSAGEAGAAADDQTVSSSQSATANAFAEQIRPENSALIAAGVLETLSQENEAVATAAASVAFDVLQSLTREVGAADDGALHEATATQQVTNSQAALASAAAQQTDTFNATEIWSRATTPALIHSIDQRNVAEATAVAAADGSATQAVSQAIVPAGAEQTADAVQTISNSQAATASAAATQVRVGNDVDIEIPAYGIYNPAITQSNEAAASAAAYNTSQIGQDSLQVAGSEGYEWHLAVTQEAVVEQSGVAEDGLAQVDRVNRAGWTGPIATPVQPSPLVTGTPQGAPETSAQEPATTASSEPRSLASVSGVLHAFRLPKAKAKAKARPRAHAPRVAHRPVHAAAPHARPVAHKSSKTKTKQTPLHRSSLPAFGASTRLPSLAASTWVSFYTESNPTRGSVIRSSGGAPTQREPGCARCDGGISLLGFGSGANGNGFAGAVAALTSRYRFAVPGVGRPQSSASALGRSVDASPIELPG
jgi:hypothetical protein